MNIQDNNARSCKSKPVPVELEDAEEHSEALPSTPLTVAKLDELPIDDRGNLVQSLLDSIYALPVLLR
jgi:hypothetical protein